MSKSPFILIVLLFSSFFCWAQPGDPNGGNPPGTVPISGIEILMVAGGLLGMRHLVVSKKSKK